MTWFWGNDSQPLIALLDSEGEQVLETAGILDIQVGQSKQFSTHTLENGEVVSDNEIDNQDRVNLSIILDPDDYIEVFAELQTLYDANTAFNIQTRVETYSNMYIESMPHDESSSMADTVAINLSFVEQMISTTSSQTLSSSDVDSAADQSTVKSGQKSSTQSETVLDSLFGWAL